MSNVGTGLMAEPLELCDQHCGTLECHSYGCVILNSSPPHKSQEPPKEVASQETNYVISEETKQRLQKEHRKEARPYFVR